ncbi:MAG: SDR family NAD(P)-dependent oxidoreductase, partial [Actinomycetota bacterium]
MNDAFGRVRSVLVLGGGSDIGLATAHRLVERGACRVILAARKPDDLGAAADALRATGATTVETIAFDADALDTHQGFVKQMFALGQDIDAAVLSFGVLADQSRAERDPGYALDVLRTNFLGAVSLLLPLADGMIEQGHGSIIVLSSVAGERGRRSNYVYGSSKAGLDVFCQGLADRLAPTGVRLLVVRPGFVRSKMTVELRSAPFAVSPAEVADVIIGGM